MRKLVMLISVLLFFTGFSFGETKQQNLNDVMQLIEALQQQRIVIQQEYIDAQKICANSRQGITLNFVGFDSINESLGSNNTTACRRANALKFNLEQNQNRLMQATYTMQQIQET